MKQKFLILKFRCAMGLDYRFLTDINTRISSDLFEMGYKVGDDKT